MTGRMTDNVVSVRNNDIHRANHPPEEKNGTNRPWSVLVWNKKHIQLADVLSRPHCLFLFPRVTPADIRFGSVWRFDIITSINRS